MTDTKVPATTDLSDDFPALVRHAASIFRDYGGRIAFCGPVATLKVPDDNSKVRETVESPGEGRVLVVDGGGAMTYALFGGNLGKLAEQALGRWPIYAAVSNGLTILKLGEVSGNTLVPRLKIALQHHPNNGRIAASDLLRHVMRHVRLLGGVLF